MPRKPFNIDVGPFPQGGMNTQATPQLLGPAEAQLSTGVDYSDGTLKGLYMPGTAAATITASASTAYFTYRDGAASPWRTNTHLNFTCLDGSIGLNTYGISYYTDVNGSTPGAPLWSAGPNVFDVVLGLPTPAISGATAPGGASRAYRVTSVTVYVDSGITIESNPSNAWYVGACTGSVVTFTTTPANTTNVLHYTNIYATAVGIPAANVNTASYYLIGQVATGVGSFTDSGPTALPSPATLLNWDAGGSPDSALYKYDHSQPPHGAIMANTLMGSAATATGTRSGILFMAIGSTLYWSMTANPWYFPLLNVEALDDAIEAIVVDRSSAYIITQSGVYVAIGDDDTSLTITKTKATHGCNPKCGLGAVMTTHGIVYPSPLGIAILDLTMTGQVGGASRILTQDSLAYGFTRSQSGSVNYGAFQDEFYIYCLGPGKVYMMDFAAWPKLRVTTFEGLTLPIVALAQVHAYSTSLAKGLYALISDGAGHVSPCPWWPRLGAQLATPATQTPWSHLTGYLHAGDSNKKKRFTRFWLGSNTSADVKLTFTCANWDGSVAGTLTNATASGWLPSTFTGDYLTVNIVSTAGTDVFESLRIEGETYE